MPTAEQNTVSLKTSVFGLLDEAPMTPLHYCYWLLASGGTLLDGFSVVALGIAIPLLKQDMTITPVLIGLIGSALVLGAVLGATPCLFKFVLFSDGMRKSSGGHESPDADKGHQGKQSIPMRPGAEEQRRCRKSHRVSRRL